MGSLHAHTIIWIRDCCSRWVIYAGVLYTAGVPIIRLGDKEVEYNYNFRFYITTKLSNPHYSPEIASKTTIVNFAVILPGTLQLWMNEWTLAR